MSFKRLTGLYNNDLTGWIKMGKVSPMKRTKNTAKIVRVDRKRTRKDRDLAMQADRDNKRADQFVEFEKEND